MVAVRSSAAAVHSCQARPPAVLKPSKTIMIAPVQHYASASIVAQ
jgi:hypothetical protein